MYNQCKNSRFRLAKKRRKELFPLPQLLSIAPDYFTFLRILLCSCLVFSSLLLSVLPALFCSSLCALR